jgi:hypothetical protein
MKRNLLKSAACLYHVLQAFANLGASGKIVTAATDDENPG